MIIRKLLGIIFCLALTLPAYAYTEHPGKDITITPARATWTTGYFHETIIRKGLKELGYTVKAPKELGAALFFKALSLGDVDYWPNGWFPQYYTYTEGALKDSIAAVGYVFKAQGVQGYLVDKKHADQFNITSLDDFKRPEVVKAFDKNGDGKADLTSCPYGWETAKSIDIHMKEYGLTDYITTVNAAYVSAMAANIAAYKDGEAIFYYGWSPSWTVFKLKPGKDLVWINVPRNVVTSEKDTDLSRMTAETLEGAVSAPINLGFSISDVRVCANKKFLAANPSAAKFFELFTIDVNDLIAQYGKLHAGEKSPKDIERHADEWITAHRTRWDAWLEQARLAAQ
ncbi:MAG: glycine betaine/L-proline ABC transporter substrate-binding protein ProX [Desulfovibrionales bacterium]|nr:glycine betaine/L-proline ABC transporter substrate-binding protein ProX [Desulfovibrionales bacterium]